MSNDDFSRRPTAPSMAATRRDPRQTIQPTGKDSPPAAPDTPPETPESKSRSSRRTELPTTLDIMQAVEQMGSTFARGLADLAREQRDHGNRLKALEDDRKRSLSPVPALGAVDMTSPLVANPGNPGDVLVPVPARVPSMTGDPAVDAARLKALEADATEDSMRYRSLAAETAEQNRRLALLESAIKAQPAAAEKAAAVVAAKAEEQTSALERMLTNKTFANLVYMLVALFVGLVAQTLASRALTKDAAAEGAKQGAEVGAKQGAKEAAADAKPSVVIVRDREKESTP